MQITKEKNYYESLDKRTKEYKEYKKWQESLNENIGLGDVVEKATKAVGIKFDDCGCEERKKKWNKIKLPVFKFLSRRRPECLTLDEFSYLKQWFDKKKTRVSPKEQRELLAIYNRVFRTNKKITNCSSCLKDVSTRLNHLMKGHES